MRIIKKKEESLVVGASNKCKFAPVFKKKSLVTAKLGKTDIMSFCNNNVCQLQMFCHERLSAPRHSGHKLSKLKDWKMGICVCLACCCCVTSANLMPSVELLYTLMIVVQLALVRTLLHLFIVASCSEFVVKKEGLSILHVKLFSVFESLWKL